MRKQTKKRQLHKNDKKNDKKKNYGKIYILKSNCKKMTKNDGKTWTKKMRKK